MYTCKTSWHTEVLRHYPEFPECREIKRMRKQWIPGPFLRFFEWAWVRGYTQSVYRRIGLSGAHRYLVHIAY